MSELRRYEIFLPLRFNDGQPVPAELVAKTLLEVEQQYGAVSWETQIVRGVWHHDGMVFRDDLTRVFVDVSDTPANREFFLQLKDRLKERFRQIDIWMTTYLVETL